MRTFHCVCGATLFFDNTMCGNCGREAGWCPACQRITALLPDDSAPFRCGNAHCGVQLSKCHNYFVEHVCNRCLVVETTAEPGALCDCCRYNVTIPNLAQPGNRARWARLEAAKRRLFYGLDLLGLPRGSAEDGFQPPLAFHFLSANPEAGGVATSAPVFTGHQAGQITIDLQEADPVLRERQRVELGEPQRTLLGHYRHEIGHYYFEVLVRGRDEAAFAALFGAPDALPYAQAQQAYYQNGPAPDWPARHISAYASMHPWEDFAETFNAYLDLMAVLDTAANLGFPGAPALDAPLTDRLTYYERFGMLLNELNRSMGLPDPLPDVFVTPVRRKMEYIDARIRQTPPTGQP